MCDTDEPWFRACEASELPNGGRIHIEVDGRYVTIFRNKGELSCIDARKLKLQVEVIFALLQL